MKRSIDNVQVMDSIYESILPEFRHMIFDLEEKDVDEEIEDTKNLLKPNVVTSYSDQATSNKFLEIVANHKTRILCDTIYNIMKFKDRIKLGSLFIEQLSRDYNIPPGYLRFKVSVYVMINMQSVCRIGSSNEYDVVLKLILKENNDRQDIYVNGHLTVPIKRRLDNTEYPDYNSAHMELVSTVRIDDIKLWIISKRYAVYDIIKHDKINETVLGLNAML